MGNKLVEEWKARQAEMKEKLRFVIAALTDKDKMFILMAYNGLQQRAAMLNGVGMNNTEQLKIQLIKRLTNSGYNMQGMGVNCIREFLKDARIEEENDRLEAERQMKEKSRILKRIMDSNVRLMSAGYNKLLEEWKANQANMKEKLRFVIAALTDKDKMFTLMAYNGMKQYALMLSGVGMSNTEMLKIQLIKRLTNKGYNMQVMGVNCIREFLKDARIEEE